MPDCHGEACCGGVATGFLAEPRLEEDTGRDSTADLLGAAWKHRPRQNLLVRCLRKHFESVCCRDIHHQPNGVQQLSRLAAVQTELRNPFLSIVTQGNTFKCQSDGQLKAGLLTN